MSDTKQPKSVLKAIGARGLVFHRGESNGGNYTYFADNDKESWRTRQVSDLGKLAMERGFDPRSVEVLLASGAPVAVFTPQGQYKGKTVFINLDAFHALDGGSDTASKAGPDPDATADAVLVLEKQKCYSVSGADFHDLDGADAAEAKILVRRGVLTAGIPSNDIPYGTNCVLVNLTQLLPP